MEAVAGEQDLVKLGDVPGVGIKKARQLKGAAENYLLDEQKLRAELDAERAAGLPPAGGVTVRTEAGA